MSFLASVLAFFYDLVPNYAAAIGLLTLAVMIVLLPLTLKGTRSMLAMQRLAPDLKKLQEKHKNDRQKLNEEMMALYKHNKINPLGGCLPLLLQIPVFIVLYQVISGLTAHKNGQPSPKYLDHNTDLYRDLVADGGKMVSFGMDLANHASAKHPDFLTALPFYLLIIVMVAVQYWQTHQVMSRSPSSADTPQAKQMRTMQKFFPPIFGVISLSIPAGVVLYWLISSLFRVGQQAAMYRFDPLLKTTVSNAHNEASKLLNEGNGHPRAQKKQQNRSGSTSSKKKRKGR